MEAARKPLARSKDLIIEELGDEFLVYDLEADRGHCLSPTAARVWRRCDGRTSVEAMVAQLEIDAGTVDAALGELATCELLATPGAGSTRRELGIRIAKISAAAAAAPLIVSVAAPTPAMAVTLGFCSKFSSPNCGAGGDPNDLDTGCKAAGCCCCTPPQFPGATKQCVDVFANCTDTPGEPPLENCET